MIKNIRRRTVGVASPLVILAIVLGVVAVIVVAVSLGHHAVWPPFGPTSAHSSSHSAAAHDPGQSLDAPAATTAGATVASLQLLAQDVTPSSTHLGVTASGFMRSEQVNVTIKDAEGYTYEQVSLQANGDGRLLLPSLALPQQLATGTYQVVAVGDTSHRTAWATFRMHDLPPTIALDAYTATPGQVIGFTGSGFIAGEQVQLTLGTQKAALATVRATGTGAVSGQVKIPALAAGNYTLTIIGSQSQSPASVGFNIQGFAPWVVLNRYAVMPGQGIGLIGQGFAAGEQVLVYLNSTPGKGEPVLRVTADASGRVVVQDTWVPSGVSGRNALTLVGQVSKASAAANFTILPDNTPTPATP